ncbi:hypothetical protein Plhal304r1_c082g0167021 [Plasmopara halstedii]
MRSRSAIVDKSPQPREITISNRGLITIRLSTTTEEVMSISHGNWTVSVSTFRLLLVSRKVEIIFFLVNIWHCKDSLFRMCIDTDAA